MSSRDMWVSFRKWINLGYWSQRTVFVCIKTCVDLGIAVFKHLQEYNLTVIVASRTLCGISVLDLSYIKLVSTWGSRGEMSIIWWRFWKVRYIWNIWLKWNEQKHSNQDQFSVLCEACHEPTQWISMHCMLGEWSEYIFRDNKDS